MILIDPELQTFAVEVTNTIIPDIKGIIRVYKENSAEGLTAYLIFIEKVKPSLERIIKGLRDPREIGIISPRLSRDPSEVMTHGRFSEEEKEAHVVGYLEAILQLIYCRAKGLEVWQFPNTPLHAENLKTRNVGKIDALLSQIQIVEEEIELQLIYFNRKKKSKITKKKEIQINVNREQIQKFDYLYEHNDDEDAGVPFTSRLMAYYRAQEYNAEAPLIVDPFAERLAGDLISYANKHKFVVQRGDYPLVRSYYIERNLLTPWCTRNDESQIVLVGAGLDTRAYRFKPLQINKHIIFEMDFSSVIRYKESILKSEKLLCDLERIATDLSNPEWAFHLIEHGFLSDIPTFWILEGLVYYMDQEVVVSLLKSAAEMSTPNSQIFVDVCVPPLAELAFGPFTRYFKWGLDKKDVPAFFIQVGWKISCSYADDHDQGRDVGQRGLIFVHGTRISE